jgi:hypothetical protein
MEQVGITVDYDGDAKLGKTGYVILDPLTGVQERHEDCEIAFELARKLANDLKVKVLITDCVGMNVLGPVEYMERFPQTEQRENGGRIGNYF